MLGEHVVLELHLGAQIWPIVVDATQLEAALTNLAANARDAMPDGGSLDVVTQNVRLDASYVAQHREVTEGDYVLIEVSDTGCGIAREIIGQIFEPFFTTKDPGKGSGLGLSMVFGFIKQSGGHVAVYSEVDLGTTFRLYLPRATLGNDVTEDHVDLAPLMGGHETVLVVEDNEQLRRVTVQGMRMLGYQVLEAANAECALELLGAHDEVQLLFTDIVMPGNINGPELAARAVRQWPHLKVLLTSGFPDMRGSGKARGGAASRYRLLAKPYRYDELAKAVRQALDERHGEVAATTEECACAC
jgi:CheY-like chemotaxis protein